jgi:hypothetical protein
VSTERTIPAFNLCAVIDKNLFQGSDLATNADDITSLKDEEGVVSARERQPAQIWLVTIGVAGWLFLALVPEDV